MTEQETTQVATAIAPTQKVENKKSLAPLENGLLVPANFEDQYRLAKCYIESKLLPKSFDTPEKVITGLQFVRELGLKAPLAALRGVAVINGTPSLFGDLPLALVKASDLILSMDEFLVDKESRRISLENKNLTAEPFAAVCHTVRKPNIVVTTVFTIEDAKKAGLLGKGVWVSYPKRMMQMRARGLNLKDNFPDVLAGMAVAEYDFNYDVQDDKGQVTVEVSNTNSSDLNKELLSTA